MKTTVFKTRNLTKKYHHVPAVEGVSLSLEKGDIYGLIGKNGAGKTTLIRLITSLALPDMGEIELWGEASESGLNTMRRRIGAIVEDACFYPFMSARDNLEYYRIQRGIAGKGCVEEALELVGLSDTGKKKFQKFSLGMKQRLGLALAIMHRPDFLILDEPTNGLDPMGIVEIRNVLLRLNQEREVTILISSHILSELSTLATRYGFIHKGRLVNEITASELESQCQEYLEVVADNTERAAMVLETCLDCRAYEVLPDGVLRVYGFLDQAPLLSQTLSQNGVGLCSLTPKGTSLEDYFISVIGGAENA